MHKPRMFLLSLSLSLSLVFPSLCFAEETLTITTYYPSPYGSYRQLTADQIAIGSNYRNPTYSDGTLYVQGNVGIGTTGPATKLDVVGIGQFQGLKTTEDNSQRLFLGRYSSVAPFSFIAPSTNSSGIKFNNATITAELVTIQNNGKVGIGTGNPDTKLHVNGDVKITNGTFILQGPNRDGAAYGREEGEAFTSQCEREGEVVIGIKGRFGDHINQLQVVCSKL